MLCVHRSNAHDPPPPSFKSAQEAPSKRLPTGSPSGLPTGLPTLGTHPERGCRFSRGSGRECQGPCGILGSCVPPGARHRLSNPDRRAMSPMRRHFLFLGLGAGIAGLVRGALTRPRHKGGAGALGDMKAEGHDAELRREPVPWRKRRLVR